MVADAYLWANQQHMSFPHVNPLQTAAWKALGEHYAAMHSKKIKELFKDNPARFEEYSISFEDILFDYPEKKLGLSKNTLLLIKLVNNTLARAVA